MKKRLVSIAMALVVSVLCVSTAFAQGILEEGHSRVQSSGGKERAAWGYIDLQWANKCSEAYASMSTYSGTAYYLQAKVYATYSNGSAKGPSDTKSGYNTDSVTTNTIYENERYRQFFAEGKIRDTSSSGTQTASTESPLWEG